MNARASMSFQLISVQIKSDNHKVLLLLVHTITIRLLLINNTRVEILLCNVQCPQDCIKEIGHRSDGRRHPCVTLVSPLCHPSVTLASL